MVGYLLYLGEVELSSKWVIHEHTIFHMHTCIQRLLASLPLIR